MSLTKTAAMEYMARRGRPVTAKELAIDLDSRASTASELLERMTAQGLCTRVEAQRPREYTLLENALASPRGNASPAPPDRLAVKPECVFQQLHRLCFDLSERIDAVCRLLGVDANSLLKSSVIQSEPRVSPNRGAAKELRLRAQALR